MEQRFVSEQGRDLAYHHTEGTGPTVVFLGGFKSDMEGTKALFLERWAQDSGRAYLRFDYSGHGVSGGEFTDGCIGDWFEDACAVLEQVAGPLVLVGSSMGGWISLLVAREMPERVRGLVGKLIGWMFRKSVLGDKPFGKNSPTGPDFIVDDERDFDVEAGKLIETLQRVGRDGPAAIRTQVHPFFGKMSPEEAAARKKAAEDFKKRYE